VLYIHKTIDSRGVPGEFVINRFKNATAAGRPIAVTQKCAGIDHYRVEAFTDATPDFHFRLILAYGIVCIVLILLPFFFLVDMGVYFSTSQRGNRAHMNESRNVFLESSIYDIGRTLHVDEVNFILITFMK